MKTLIAFIGTIYIICIVTGDIMANGKKDNASVEMSICLIVGKDGTYLEPRTDGLVFIRVYNQTTDTIAIPLFCLYGKGENRDLKPSYVANDITFYTGFEIATIKYYFMDSEGNNVIENVVVCSPDALTLPPKQYKILCIPIRTPSKAGTYKLKLVFDNKNLEKAIYSHNFVDLNIKRNFFRSEMLLERIIVKE